MEGGEDQGKYKTLKNKTRSSDEDVKKHKRKRKIYTSSSSGSSDDSCRRKKKSKHKRSDGVEEKRKRKDRHKKDKKMKKKLKDKKKSKRSKETSDDEGAVDIPIGLMSTSMAPMTKEEWDKQQSVVRKVYDESTGRHRLIKGDGEVIEEIVSRERHKAINQEATRGDGNYFQANLQKKMNR